MTTYTAITNGQIDQDSPITQPLMTALRDNPIAITEGATGAPRIRGEAAAQLDDLPTLTVSAADTYTMIGSLATNVFAATNTNSTSFVLGATVTITKATGTARLIGVHRTSNSGTTSFLRILKNGTEIGAWSTNSTTNVTRTVDASIIIGDVFTFEHRVNFDTQSSTMSSGASASDAYTTANFYGQASNL